jgi:cob(I)alamin adenosyltransferase
VLATDLPEPVRRCLTRIQHELFDLGGELCMPGTTLIPTATSTGSSATSTV